MKYTLKQISVLCLLLVLSANSWAKKIKVACIGNSVTYGYKVEDRETNCYPYQLQQMLGKEYDVRNFGHSGATLLYHGHNPYIKTDEYKKAMDFQPDIVIIHLGLNDTDPRDWPNYRNDFYGDYKRLIDSFRSKENSNTKIFVCSMTPIFSEHPRFNSGTQQWYWQVQGAIQNVAKSNSVGIIDLYSSLYNRSDLFEDGLHPNRVGDSIMAKQILQNITGNFGGLKMPNIYSSSMVLQRDKPIPLVGTANIGDKVQITFAGRTKSVLADKHGKWKVIFKPMPAGGPYEIHVHSSNKELNFEDIMIGEVWLCSGQSNMSFPLKSSDNGKEAVENRSHSSVRVYNMEASLGTLHWSDSLMTAVKEGHFYKSTQWKECTKEIALNMSAIGYYFGEKLSNELHVPVGIIQNAVGGSPMQSWLYRKILDGDSQLNLMLDRWYESDFVQPWARKRALDNLNHPKNPRAWRHPFEPAYLYEQGIEPIAMYPIKGVLWYQGESNAEKPELHDKMFKILVKEFRSVWNNPDLPVGYVQLSSLNRISWPYFRDSQRRLESQIEIVGMVVSSDVGDSINVHYTNKKPIGERLANWALATQYNFNIEYSGPQFKDVEAIGSKLRVFFAHAHELKSSDNKELRCFEVAGSDHIFYPAQAIIKNVSVVVSSPEVSKPVYVRYAWQPFTRANLVNENLLPASTFTSEDSM